MTLAGTVWMRGGHVGEQALFDTQHRFFLIRFPQNRELGKPALGFGFGREGEIIQDLLATEGRLQNISGSVYGWTQRV